MPVPPVNSADARAFCLAAIASANRRGAGRAPRGKSVPSLQRDVHRVADLSIVRYGAGYCLVGLFFIERALSHIGVDVSWANAVCADVEARPLERHAAGHLNNRGFCCRISFIRLIYIKIKKEPYQL